MNEPDHSIFVPTWAQGRTGMGQGGYTAGKFCEAIGQPVSVALKAPIPLETEMTVHTTSEGWSLMVTDHTIMSAVVSDVGYATTSAVSASDAIAASARFTGHVDHKAPHCLSCGTVDRSMRVWPGLVDDGTDRVATPWTPPPWTDDGNGCVEVVYAWMALDCACGSVVDSGPDRRDSLTVQYAVDIVEPIQVGQTYVIVGFDGNWSGGWDGRKRGAAACVFDADANIVARADSFWVSLPQ